MWTFQQNFLLSLLFGETNRPPDKQKNTEKARTLVYKYVLFNRILARIRYEDMRIFAASLFRYVPWILIYLTCKCFHTELSDILVDLASTSYYKENFARHKRFWLWQSLMFCKYGRHLPSLGTGAWSAWLGAKFDLTSSSDGQEDNNSPEDLQITLNWKPNLHNKSDSQYLHMKLSNWYCHVKFSDSSPCFPRILIVNFAERNFAFIEK